MYKYFKVTNILYWALFLGGLAAFLILFLLLRPNACIRTDTWGTIVQYAIFAAVALLWSYGSDYAIEALAMRKMRKVLNILYEECDPERFLSNIDKMLKVDNKEVYNTYMVLNRARGLAEAGRMQEASNTVLGIYNFTRGRRGRSNNLYQLNLLAATQIGLKEYVEAEKTLSLFKEMLDKSKMSENRRILFDMAYEQKRIILDMQKGIYDGAEGKLNTLFDKAGDELSRATTKYYLGEVYAHSGREDEAREAFQYVIDHGNKLHIVEKAKEELEKMA